MHRQPLVIFEKMTKLLSFLLKKVHQISAKLNAFQQNMPRKLPQNWPFLLVIFQQNVPKIGCFPANLTMKNPQNLTFFATYQKPCYQPRITWKALGQALQWLRNRNCHHGFASLPVIIYIGHYRQVLIDWLTVNFSHTWEPSSI